MFKKITGIFPFSRAPLELRPAASGPWTIMKSSTQDKVEGNARQLSGKIKEVAGRTTNNPGLQARGQNEQIDGQVQKKVGDIKKVFDR
jgi:uncharacterized protein YjbJ (UPF0337 family)